MLHVWHFITYDVAFRSVRQSVFEPRSLTGSRSSCGSCIVFASLSLTCKQQARQWLFCIYIEQWFQLWFINSLWEWEMFWWIMKVSGILCANIMLSLVKVHEINVLWGNHGKTMISKCSAEPQCIARCSYGFHGCFSNGWILMHDVWIQKMTLHANTMSMKAVKSKSFECVWTLDDILVKKTVPSMKLWESLQDPWEFFQNCWESHQNPCEFFMECLRISGSIL
jgi:hypothetical protein